MKLKLARRRPLWGRQETLEGVEVLAWDSGRLEKSLQMAPPALKMQDDAVDIALLPFVLQRLCHGDVRALLALTSL